jgi:hypothetical protein
MVLKCEAVLWSSDPTASRGLRGYDMRLICGVPIPQQAVGYPVKRRVRADELLNRFNPEEYYYGFLYFTD